MMNRNMCTVHGEFYGPICVVCDAQGMAVECDAQGMAVEAIIEPNAAAASPLATQVGGLHYKKCKIQPIEYVHANNIGYCEGTAIKYLTRWKDKGGIEDLKKAIHFIELLIELESKKES